MIRPEIEGIDIRAVVTHKRCGTGITRRINILVRLVFYVFFTRFRDFLFVFVDSRSKNRGGYSSQKSRDREYSKKDKYSGDWSEHVSSSGKKYYYNCKTEVSQWEKPREWLEKER